MNEINQVNQVNETAVLRPGHPSYDEERAGFQAAYAHRPALVVAAESAEDVAGAVAYAKERGLGVAVQSTGHGLSAAADERGVLISTGRLKDLSVDPVRRVARAGAGVRWAEVIAAAAEHGLAPLNGSAPGVGVVGYLTGGGVGILGRQFGYAADHVRSFDIVTADGRPRRVDAEREPELFWALRGGGGGFGAVTSVEFGLVPLRSVYGGVLAFADEQVEGALAAYTEWAESLPETLTSSVALMRWPDAPFAPEAFRGRHVLQVRIAFTGSAAEGEQLVAPLREFGTRGTLGAPVVDDLRVMPYTESHTIHSDPPEPHPYDGDNLLVDGAAPLDAAALKSLTGPDAAGAVVQLKHLGGAFGRAPEVPNAVGHRGAGWLVGVLSALYGTDREADREAVRAAHGRVLAPFLGRAVGRQLNHLFGEFGVGVVREAYEPGVWERLGAVKAGYDPGDVFRYAYGVRPGAGE